MEVKGFNQTSSTTSNNIAKYIKKNMKEWKISIAPAKNVHLVSERDVVPEDHHLLIQVIVDGVRTVGGDSDALPLGAPVLDPVQSHDWFSLRWYW